MENIIIEARGHMPYIEFNTDGNLKMEGRAIPEDVNKMFDPLIGFVDNLSVEKAVFDVNLDYFNTATSKRLLDLMKHLEENNKIGEVCVYWRYEEGDEDSLEMGKIYEERLKQTNFTFHEHAEAA